MRWDGLFDDLEAHAQALEHAERAAEVQTRTRGEVGGLALTDRLRASLGAPLRVHAGGLSFAGQLARVGPDWLLLDEGAGREVLIVTAHVVSVRGLGRLTAAGTEGVVASRLGLRHALRGVARDRSAVRVHVTSSGATGTGADLGTLDGTIDRVAADFLDLAAHPAGESRRRQDVREVELVALAAVVAVRRQV